MGQPATSIIRYAPFFTHRQARTVLDYGTGKMRNARYLADKGFTVYAADLPEQVNVILSGPSVDNIAALFETGDLPATNLNVDLVISTYVFNIIAERKDREEYLDNVVRNLRPGGYLLIEVRCRREHERCGVGCVNYFKSAECAKAFTHDELDTALAPRGFTRICHYYRKHALAAVYRLDVPLKAA